MFWHLCLMFFFSSQSWNRRHLFAIFQSCIGLQSFTLKEEKPLFCLSAAVRPRLLTSLNNFLPSVPASSSPVPDSSSPELDSSSPVSHQSPARGGFIVSAEVYDLVN